jgi:hypothetical protein
MAILDLCWRSHKDVVGYLGPCWGYSRSKLWAVSRHVWASRSYVGKKRIWGFSRQPPNIKYASDPAHKITRVHCVHILFWLMPAPVSKPAQNRLRWPLNPKQGNEHRKAVHEKRFAFPINSCNNSQRPGPPRVYASWELSKQRKRIQLLIPFLPERILPRSHTN